jgi:hypothetical protein
MSITTEPTARPTTTAPENAPFLTGVALLGAVACYLVGGVGHGLAAEYGMSLTEGGLWQVVLLAAGVVGSLWAGLVLLLARWSGHRLSPLLVVAAGLVCCFLAGAVGSALGAAEHREGQQAAREACAGGVGRQMQEVADATRPAASLYVARPQGTPTGCLVDVAFPVGTNARAHVARHIAPLGFVPAGERSWVRDDLLVRMHADGPDGEKEYLVAFYGSRG